MKDPEHVKIAKPSERTTELVDQYYSSELKNKKFDHDSSHDVEQTRTGTYLTDQNVWMSWPRGLKIAGFRAEGIHGDLDLKTNVFVSSVISQMGTLMSS